MAKLGGYEFEKVENMKELTQRAATAWGTVEGSTGAKYELIAYCGKQLVRGTNHCFIAKETLQTIGQEERIVAVVVNEFNGEFEIVRDKFEVIFG